jgi:lipopolysaccharide cholinephosphotransferase
MEDLSRYNPEGSILRKAQLRTLDILLVLDELCRKNNIQYYIAYGTVLGAVRHGGFIPWDDDIDIMVLGDDYERFQEVCKEQLPDWLFLQNAETDPNSGMGKGLFKVRDKQSLFIESYDSFSKDYNRGLFVDVYKAVTIPKRPEKLVGYLLTRISYAYNFYRYNKPINLHNIVCYFLYPISYVWHKSLLWLISQGGKPYYCCQLGEGIYLQHHPTLYDDIFPLREIEFEGHKLMGPNNPDGYLRAIYNDYMRIPAPEKRRVHGFYYIPDANSVALRYEETGNK